MAVGNTGYEMAKPPGTTDSRKCAFDGPCWAARMALGNAVEMFTVKAMLTHVGSHQITNRHSAFSPPGQDAEAAVIAVIAKRS